MTSPLQPFAAHVLDALPSAVLVTDPEGRAVFVNVRGVEILGRSAAEIVGTDVSDLFECKGVVDASGEARSTTRVTRPNGEIITLGYTLSAVHLGAEQSLCAISFRDISDTVRLTAERDRLLQLAAVGEAMPTLLHEVRNPLSAVLATVELLLEDSTPGHQRDALYAVLTEARRIALQLDGVGAVGRSLRSRRASAIDSACNDICTVMQGRAEKSGVHLVWDVATLPLLPLDASTTRAVLFNLLTNALHACRQGSTIRVHVRLVHDDRDLEITVVDTGAGMSAEVYAKCTDLFFTTKRHGSGIGLALVRRAVEEAGGRMDIQSVPGVGTAVFLVVPVTRSLGPESDWPPP